MDRKHRIFTEICDSSIEILKEMKIKSVKLLDYHLNYCVTLYSKDQCTNKEKDYSSDRLYIFVPFYCKVLYVLMAYKISDM